MPHNASQYVATNILPQIVAARPSVWPISHIDAAVLTEILGKDAFEYFYSASISTASALSSIALGYFTWATVKLYYSDYYLLRGILALSRLCVFYEGSKPRTLVAGALEVAKAPGGGSRRNATTHGVVIEAAKTHLSHIAAFSQDIGSVHPLDWIREKREEANYGHSRFSEPEAPVHMKI